LRRNAQTGPGVSKDDQAQMVLRVTFVPRVARDRTSWQPEQEEQGRPEEVTLVGRVDQSRTVLWLETEEPCQPREEDNYLDGNDCWKEGIDVAVRG
jgi:hypothetical protein